MTTTTMPIPSWAQSRTDLSSKTALVIGGAGGVGEGITRALLAGGATVIATSRGQAKLDDLRARINDPGLAVRTLDVMGPELDHTAREFVSDYGPIDGVVIAIGDWGTQGRKGLLDLTNGEWDALVAANQTSVFRAYRSLVPVLAPGSMIAQINGMSAEIPFPGAGAVAATAAATKSLTRTLAAELEGRGPRVYEVILGVIRTRPRQLAGIDNAAWVLASDVGVHIAELVAGTSRLTADVTHWFVDPLQGPQATQPRLPSV